MFNNRLQNLQGPLCCKPITAEQIGLKGASSLPMIPLTSEPKVSRTN
jgi:hypothetical protein